MKCGAPLSELSSAFILCNSCIIGCGAQLSKLSSAFAANRVVVRRVQLFSQLVLRGGSYRGDPLLRLDYLLVFP